MVEGKIKKHVSRFFLDDPKDIKSYEEIINNPNCAVVKKETVVTKEVEREFNEDGHMIRMDEQQRINWVVEWQEEVIE